MLLDIDDVAAGHVTKQRRNPEDQWQWSREPAHEPLVSMDDWKAVQDVFSAGTRTSASKRRRTHDYLLKGMITCNACGRKLVANVVRGRLQYRCRVKDEYPGLADARRREVGIELGRLLESVDLNTTNVILVGDNGTPGQVVQAPYGPTGAAGHSKGDIYEGGIHVPFVAAGPDVTLPAGSMPDRLR